ncbi:hypothetical protein ABN702_05355 [Bacillus haimaensis]|uniref:hypothetical protein n=1 Tax=Bacillus haimaensis TaxID=3160967 RepID=UPI003AA8DD69
MRNSIAFIILTLLIGTAIYQQFLKAEEIKPATFFIDEDGLIVGKQTGELDYEKLVEAKYKLFD